MELAVKDQLPAYRRLCDVIGRQSAQLICDRWGGVTLRIPKTELAGMFKKIVETIGRSGAVSLIAHFGGDSIYIPRLSQFGGHAEQLRIARNRQIVDEYSRGGTSATKLALKYSTSDRNIYKILKQNW